MNRVILALIVLALVPAACSTNSSGVFDQPLSGGFIDTEEPESYNGRSLYTYMDGGAELYLEYGFSNLSVRRYVRGRDRYLVEVYEMRDPESAAAVYTYGRRAGKEADLVPGCPASITGSEIQLARGSHYLVCRNEDPMAKTGPRLVELARQITQRLQGDCGTGQLFVRMPAERRVPGSEIALSGPIGLNVRPWLSTLGKNGFTRGWIASYKFPDGEVEALLAEYDSPKAAQQAVGELKKSAEPGVDADVREEVVAVTRAPGVPREDIASLISSLLSEPEWR